MVARRLYQGNMEAPQKRGGQPQKQRLRDVNFFPKMQEKLLGQVSQDLLGISDDQLSGMYRLAWDFLEQEAFADAVRAFTLLCHIHHFVPDFWFGLGRALRGCGQPEDALSMVLVAETIDPSRFEFYQEEIECCLQMGNKKEAAHIMNRLHAHRQSIDEFKEKRDEIRQLKARIVEMT